VRDAALPARVLAKETSMNDGAGAPAPPNRVKTSSNVDKTIVPGCVLKDGDYTFYVTRRPSKASAAGNPHAGGINHGNIDLHRHFARYESFLSNPAYGGSQFSAALSGTVYDPASTGNASIEGRLLACRCYADAEIAVTIRGLSKKGAEQERPVVKDGWNDRDNGYRSKPDATQIPYAMPLDEICERFAPLGLFDSGVTGLVLVTGATNSAKSDLTRALIHRFLDVRRGNARWPHLVTFEDPIEKRLFPTSAEALARGIEYTPRQKGIDVDTLKDALEDALRQTPAVFYVGEVRAEDDWKELLSFAGTGHLVVATAHAASLVEAMERIFRGVGAETAAKRGQIAQRILAVIHQRAILPHLTEPLSILPRDFKILLPAIWRRTPAGIAALISDGLASVLPHTPREGQDINRISAFGRRWFAKGNRDETVMRWTAIIYATALADPLKRHCESLTPSARNSDHWKNVRNHQDAHKILAFALAHHDGALSRAGSVAVALQSLIKESDLSDLARWLDTTLSPGFEAKLSAATPGVGLSPMPLEAARELASRTLSFLESEAIRLDLQGA
jgi:hypothetical protein